MTLEQVLAEMASRFTSGNSIPVERAMIKAEEWSVIQAQIEDLRAQLEEVLLKDRGKTRDINLLTKENRLLGKALKVATSGATFSGEPSSVPVEGSRPPELHCKSCGSSNTTSYWITEYIIDCSDCRDITHKYIRGP